jgi:hypothetical protein
MALAALPGRARPRRGDPGSPAVLIRTDAAGATHVFAAAVRERGCSFSLGFGIDERVQEAVLRVPARAWTPAYDIGGQPCDGAQVAEITGWVNLAAWPQGSRLPQGPPNRCKRSMNGHIVTPFRRRPEPFHSTPGPHKHASSDWGEAR